MENYNFNPNTYDDIYNNAELLVRKYLKYDGIDDFHYKRDNNSIYHVMTIDKKKIKTIEDITKYFDSKPIIIKDKTIAEYLKDKKNRRQHERDSDTGKQSHRKYQTEHRRSGCLQRDCEQVGDKNSGA